MISVLLSLALYLSMTALCSGTAWTKISNGLCRRGAPFTSLVLAQAACRRLGSSCEGVNDEYCDGSTSFVCQGSSLLAPRTTGCLYEPEWNPRFSPFRPFSSKAELKSAVDALEDCSCTDTSAPTGVFRALKWERLDELVNNKFDKGRSQSRVSLVPGPEGGIQFEGNIKPGDDPSGVGFATCQTAMDASTTPLGFSPQAKALRLEVTGDGQPYRVTLRQSSQDRFGTGQPRVWQAQFATKDGERTVVDLPLDKETWSEMDEGRVVAEGKLPEWSKLQGIGLEACSADMHDDENPWKRHWPFKVTVHTMEMVEKED